MKESVSNGNLVTPMLFPYEPEQFWQSIRQIIREEVNNAEKQRPISPTYETPGMTYKPLYKIAEVCTLFHVTKPTIYDWVKHGKLKPYKIRSRVYFLWQDIQQLLHPDQA
jgi:excisionase family DNA binding protein